MFKDSAFLWFASCCWEDEADVQHTVSHHLSHGAKRRTQDLDFRLRGEHDLRTQGKHGTRRFSTSPRPYKEKWTAWSFARSTFRRHNVHGRHVMRFLTTSNAAERFHLAQRQSYQNTSHASIPVFMEGLHGQLSFVDSRVWVGGGADHATDFLHVDLSSTLDWSICR